MMQPFIEPQRSHLVLEKVYDEWISGTCGMGLVSVCGIVTYNAVITCWVNSEGTPKVTCPKCLSQSEYAMALLGSIQ